MPAVLRAAFRSQIKTLSTSSDPPTQASESNWLFIGQSGMPRTKLPTSGTTASEFASFRRRRMERVRSSPRTRTGKQPAETTPPGRCERSTRRERAVQPKSSICNAVQQQRHGKITAWSRHRRFRRHVPSRTSGTSTFARTHRFGNCRPGRQPKHAVITAAPSVSGGTSPHTRSVTSSAEPIVMPSAI